MSIYANNNKVFSTFIKNANNEWVEPKQIFIDDGFNSQTKSLNSVFGSEIQSTCFQPDGKVIVVGQFITYKGNSRNRIIRLNVDGSEDVSFYNNLISTGNNSGFNDLTPVKEQASSTSCWLLQPVALLEISMMLF